MTASLILNVAKSALSAQQTVISNTANNIANVNTEGYTRRRVMLEERPSTTEGLPIGRGVDAKVIERLGDAFLERVSRDASATSQAALTEQEILERAQDVFDISGDIANVGSTLEQFFGALGNLTVNPTSTELRANVLEQGRLLTTTINRTYNHLTTLQTEADDRINQEVLALNSLLNDIATLNGQIRAIETGDGTVAASERDQREVALTKLSEIIEVDVVEEDSGQVTIALSNGFTLVNSTTVRELSVTKTPSFVTGTVPPALSGGPMNYLVYDYDSTSGLEHINLTDMVADRGGRLGGLLRVRGVHTSNSNTSPFQAEGDLVDLASRLEAFTRVLLTEFNQVYLGVSVDNLVSSGGSPLTDDENPTASPTSFSPSSGYFDASTNTSVAASGFGFFDYLTASDSVSGTVTGLPDNGDLNAVAPTLFSFASRIKVAISDGDQLATGRDLNATEGSLEIMPGDVSNIEELLKLRTQRFNMTVGSHTMTGTLADAYRDAITDVSNKVQAAQSEYNIANSSKLSADAQKDAFSAVSLDEEFSNLIRFQRSFQAAARMVRVADEMLQTVVDLV